MDAVTVEFYKIREDAILPSYSHIGDSGMKICIPQDDYVRKYETKVIPLGWAMRIPDGYEMECRSRSGYTVGLGLVVAQGTGTIDCNYRGEVGAVLYNRGILGETPEKYRDMIDSEGTIHLKRGDNVMQGIIKEVPDVIFVVVDDWDELETTRGSDGYGSTGR